MDNLSGSKRTVDYVLYKGFRTPMHPLSLCC